jgi:BirA family transcriptional regulator, biotin operon repressor / biotin---[acetyl-CoA-carboxylase] ligase
MLIGSNLLYYETLSSTNTEASRLLKSGEQTEGTVVYTGFQSSGRGQTGNRWESEEGKNLLFSTILYPRTVVPEDQFLISMTISLGICDFLDRYYRGAEIKWPNDIYVGNDKIAGILIENSILGNMIENSVIGIGLNINQDKFKEILPNPVSLKMVTGRDHDTVKCLTELLHDLDKRYKELLYGDNRKIKTDYLSRLYRFMKWTLYKSGDFVFTGRIIDVMVTGQISIEIKDGAVREFSFKEFIFLP